MSAQQLQYQYQRRAVSVTAESAAGGNGWIWRVLVDERNPMEYQGPAFATPRIALSAGKVYAEDYFDSADDA